MVSIFVYNACAHCGRTRAASLRRYHWRAATRESTNISSLLINPPPPTSRPRMMCQSHVHPRHAFRCIASEGGPGGEEDDDGGNEGWIPPDHSPLAGKRFSREGFPPSFAETNSSQREAAIPGGKIEVIDLEATLNDDRNRQYLRENSLLGMDSPQLDVQLSDVSLKEVLGELKESGETEMMRGLVQEYNLHDQLAELEEGEGESSTDSAEGEDSAACAATAADDDDNDESDEEFERSLQGLSEEEVIDELIENNLSLSQLEMEILSEQIARSERGEEGGLDFDSLENTDLNENAAYREFRAMVLEDFNAKKRVWEKSKSLCPSENVQQMERKIPDTPSETMKLSTMSDFTDYPQDWKDYDSKAAFRRDFTEDENSWVPPTSDLLLSNSYDAGEKGSREEGGGPNLSDANSADYREDKIDWLQARRAHLDGGRESKKLTHMLTPEDAESFRNQNSHIPIILHTLLTTSEISASLTAQGGTNIHIIDTSKFGPMQGVGLGCRSIMLVTGRNPSHIRILADSVVRNLKARMLNKRGVVGALQGAEGGQDIFTTKRSRNRLSRKLGVANASGKVDDEWMVVDCENIHVHILDETTRKCLNIESLWDLSNPDSEGSKLRRVDFTNDDEVDDYVAENPIPEQYAAKIFNQGDIGRVGDWITGGVGGRVQSVPILQRKSFSEKWRGVSKTKRRKSRRGH